MIVTAIDLSHGLEGILNSLMTQGAALGWTLIKAFLVFIVGRLLINLVNKLIKRVLLKRDIDPSVKSFVGSLVNVVLTILLIISVVGALGVQTTSFAALLASAGVAVGMALSGNLANFAGGLIILLFKPFKVGDYIEAQGTGGTVKEIQIFHTLIATVDNKMIYIPNGSLSSNAVVNYSKQETRRIDWTFGVEYGEDVQKVRAVLRRIIDADARILRTPEPMIVLKSLSASSVDITVRVWTKNEDYWNVMFEVNELVYDTFNKEGIGFPFPQLTVHQAKD